MMAGSGVWRIESVKYDGTPHRTWTGVEEWSGFQPPSGPERWSLTLRIPAGADVLEADGRTWCSDYDVAACFFARRCVQVMALLKQTGEEYYCNACTVAVVDAALRIVRFTDLDLDLYVDASGPRWLDEDEFAENVRRFGYPPDLVKRVRDDLSLFTNWAENRVGVFMPALFPALL